jgi:hypothetical protein
MKQAAQGAAWVIWAIFNKKDEESSDKEGEGARVRAA